MKFRHILPLTLLALLALSACASQPGPTPTPTRTALPPTPAATHTPQATPTPPPPTQTPTPASSPTPSPTPLDVNPLTGLQVPDPSVLERRPLAIKISNAPGVNVRPQSGVNSADVVFEHIAEYGVTRLTGVYLSQDADPIGSSRSCRLLDREILKMFHAALACSGLSNGNYAIFKRLPEFEEGRIMSPSYGDGAPLFYRLNNGQGIPHNMFTDTPALWAEVTERGINGRQQIRAWTFDPAPPPGGQPASALQVNYVSLDSRAEWHYDPTSGRWARWESGKPFADKLTGEQTTAANVLVVYALHINTDFVEDDNGGALSVEIQIWGDGELRLFRDGQVYQGRWRREDPSFLFAVTTADGQSIPLKPGNTWVQVVYASATQTTTNDGDTWVVESKQAP